MRPPPEVLAVLARLPRPDEPGVRWVPSQQWHVTMRFFGEADTDEVIDALNRAAPSLRAVGDVRATLGPTVARLGRGVVCVPVQGVEALAAAITDATSAIGLPADPRPFRGHVTLARLRNRAACGLTGHAVHARFEATEVELVRSVLDRDGARHELVRAFRFGR